MTPSKKKFVFAVIGAMTTGLMLVPATIPASAADSPGESLSALATTAPEVLSGDEGSGGGGSLNVESGLTVPSGSGAQVSIEPVTTIEPRIVAGGSALEYDAGLGYGFVLTGDGARSNAGFVTISGASAPTNYQFAVMVDGRPARLALTDGGSIDVLDSTGEIVNVILPAWAKDAQGQAVPTNYAVAANVITQTVEHAGAAYPVVADPSIACDALFCTIMMNRSETQTVATGSAGAVALVTAMCGIAAWACAIALGFIVDQANQAVREGKCVGVRKFHTTLVGFPVIEKCP